MIDLYSRLPYAESVKLSAELDEFCRTLWPSTIEALESTIIGKQGSFQFYYHTMHHLNEVKRLVKAYRLAEAREMMDAFPGVWHEHRR